ncbi:MAG: metallophosphoesterase [Armatimonadetes bacterium]|nr:metallophosphoesterase [Armatimonadota bacterium]
MYVAAVSDVHGRVWEPLRWACAIKQEMGLSITAILCCGDLGFFQSFDRLDKATRRHLRRSALQVEFMLRFAQRNPEVEAWLESLPELPPPMYFIRGNHEDHEILASFDERRRPVQVDAYGLIWYLPDALPLELTGERGERLRVIGVGGIEKVNLRRKHPFSAIQKQVVDTVLGMSWDSVDVLLTHDGPSVCGVQVSQVSDEAIADIPGAEPYEADFGAEAVTRLVMHLRPQDHFFGHIHRSLMPFRLGGCNCISLASVAGFSTGLGGCSGVLGLLEWDGRGKHQFRWIHERWLQEWQWSPEPELTEYGISAEGSA